MNIDYMHFRKRAEFGSQCNFNDDVPQVVCHIFPDDELMSKYIYRNPAHKSTQISVLQSEHEMNTTVVPYSEHGMFHEEGGWPKEINILDEEAVIRFRKKTERDDNYIESMRALAVPMEHAIRQNNAVNIYKQYFEEVLGTTGIDPMTARVKNVYRDPSFVERPVNHLSWSPEVNAPNLAVTYCNMEFQRMRRSQTFESYIWDIENNNTPVSYFLAYQPIVTLEYNPRDPHILAGGMYCGHVNLFDVRRGPGMVDTSLTEESHRYPCHSVIWTNSKLGTELFSSSSGGEVKWWDTRKLEKPVDSIILEITKDVPIRSRAYIPACLEYDPGIPVRYMVGTENGNVVSGNRKGTTQQEKLPWVMKAHTGPVMSIHRNCAFSKNFLTVGDWTAKIWNEDCKESPIIWSSNHKSKISGGEWSPARFSVFFLIREDGVLDLWDILLQQKKSLISLNISDQPLISLRVHEGGELVAVGDKGGLTSLAQYSPNLASNSKNDKIFLAAMFDRESRREKILESRNREIRLKYQNKIRLEELLWEGGEPVPEEALKTRENSLKAEKEYFEDVKKEIEEFRNKLALSQKSQKEEEATL